MDILCAIIVDGYPKGGLINNIDDAIKKLQELKEQQKKEEDRKNVVMIGDFFKHNDRLLIRLTPEVRDNLRKAMDYPEGTLVALDANWGLSVVGNWRKGEKPFSCCDNSTPIYKNVRPLSEA